MEIDSSFTGMQLKPFKRNITLRETMNYAAAVNDNNPVYFNDERPGGVIAPPMFAVAATWPVIANIFNLIETESFPKEAFMTMVHYTEHLEFFGPVRPDTALDIRGRIASIMPHRAGTHLVLRLDAVDGNGELLFTEHIGGMLRGVNCIGGGDGEQNLPVSPQTVEPRLKRENTVHIDPLAAHIYDGCTNIHFPIHTSPKFARSVGLPGIIYQGTATLACAIREIITNEAGNDPLRLKALSCRFTGMVMPGADITVRLLNDRNADGLFFEVLNCEGRRAISDGYVKLS